MVLDQRTSESCVGTLSTLKWAQWVLDCTRVVSLSQILMVIFMNRTDLRLCLCFLWVMWFSWPVISSGHLYGFAA